MARLQRGLTLVFLGLLLFGTARTCRATDSLQLTVSTDGAETETRLHGYFTLWRDDEWRLTLSATMPRPVTGEDEQAATLVLTWSGEDWRWSATTNYRHGTTEPAWNLRVRGAYDRGPWSMAVTGYRGESESGLDGFMARQTGPWRLSLSQDLAVARGQSGNLRYEAEAAATWRGSGKKCGFYVGGSSHQGEEAIDDTRTLYTEFTWTLGLGAGWSFGGELRLAEDEEALVVARESRLSLNLTRRAPLGIRLQAAYARDESGGEWRGGCTVSGTAGPFRWRAGTAGEGGAGGEAWESWLFAAVGWHGGAWEAELGLTPSGEYAAGSRHGYWVQITYEF